MALGLRMAGMAVHSGTIPVERLWASLQEMFPRAARRMSREWLDILSVLALLGYNYRHFHHRLFPKWTENDSLMAERVENLAAAALTLQAEDAEDYDGLASDRASELIGRRRPAVKQNGTWSGRL